jgi:hypothetical protein
VAVPLPPEVIDVPTNSVATPCESSGSKSAMSSLAKLGWRPLAMTTGFDFRVMEIPKHAAAREPVAGPLFSAAGDLGIAGPVDANNHDLLRDNMPRGGREFEAVEEPVARSVARQCVLQVHEDGAGRFVVVILRQRRVFKISLIGGGGGGKQSGGGE